MGRNSFQCPLGKMHSRSEFVTFTEQLRKNGHGDPQFYSTHREKMPSSMIYPTLKIFSFVDVQIFFSNNCCDVFCPREGVLIRGPIIRHFDVFENV